MAVELRPYQTSAIERLREKRRAGARRLVLVAPTGSGKTIIAADMIRSATERGTKTLVLAHRRILIDQTVDKLARFGVPASVMMGHDRREDDRLPVQVATVQTLARRRNRLPPAGLIVLDECHHSVSKSYRDLLDAYPGVTVIGLTATPWRTDRVGLADVYQGSVLAATPRELIDCGALVPYEAFAWDAPELHEVKLVAGEFNQKQLEIACNTQVLVGSVVAEYMEHSRGKPAIVFPVSIAHSKELVATFQAAGITAAHVDCYMPTDERNRALSSFADGSVTVISSVGILTEGFDQPRAEVGILARPTKSLTLHIQMIGRVLRPSPGKTIARLQDHSGNLLRHGLPDDERDYSLTATPTRVLALMTCPLCKAVGKPGPDGRCPRCGELIAPPAEPRAERDGREPIAVVNGQRITADDIRRIRADGARADLSDADLARAAGATPYQRAAEYLRLVELQARKGLKLPFIKYAYRDTFGEFPHFTPDQLEGVTPARYPFVRLPDRRTA